MIVFRLPKALSLQYEKSIASFYDNFAMDGTCVIIGNELFVLGNPQTVQFRFKRRKVDYMHPASEWVFDANHKIGLFEEGSIKEQVLQWILMQIRIWQQVEPFANEYMAGALLTKLNKALKPYGITAEGYYDAGEEQSYVAFLFCGQAFTLEEILNILDATDYAKMTMLRRKADLMEGEHLAALGRHEDAIPYFRKVTDFEEDDSIMYTLANFDLGDALYFTDDCEGAIAAYRKCRLQYISDLDTYYIHMGHACLDDHMREHTQMVKAYCRGQWCEAYRSSHVEDYWPAKQELADDWEDYEKQCLTIGKSKGAKRENGR